MTTIHALERMDLEDLYTQLGRQVAPLGILPSDEDAREMGKRWLERNLIVFQRRICSSEIAKGLIQQEGIDSAVDAAAIADILAGLLGGPPLATVSVILAKRGIKSLCKNYSG